MAVNENVLHGPPEPGVTAALRWESRYLALSGQPSDSDELADLLMEAIGEINEARRLAMKYRTMWRDDPDIDHASVFTGRHALPWEIPT